MKLKQYNMYVCNITHVCVFLKTKKKGKRNYRFEDFLFIYSGKNKNEKASIKALNRS